MRVLILLAAALFPMAVHAQGSQVQDLTRLDVPDALFDGKDWTRVETGLFPLELVCATCDGLLGMNADIMTRDTAPAGAFAMQDMTPQEGAAICDNRPGLCTVRAISVGSARGFAFDVGDDGLFSSSFVLFSGDDRVSLRASGTDTVVSDYRDRALAAFGPQLFGQ